MPLYEVHALCEVECIAVVEAPNKRDAKAKAREVGTNWKVNA